MDKTTRLFCKCWRSVVKALCRARDSYERSLAEFAGSRQYAAAMGYGSFTASYGFPMEMTSSWDTTVISSPCAEAPKYRRASLQPVLETIDEDKPCEFGGDVRLGFSLLPRGSRVWWYID